MRESSLDNQFSLSFTLSFSHAFASFTRSHLLTSLYYPTGRTGVSLIPREAANAPRDDHVLARPRPNFDFKISSWLYPKIYVHICGRCIRNATSLHIHMRLRIQRFPGVAPTIRAVPSDFVAVCVHIHICIFMYIYVYIYMCTHTNRPVPFH